MLNVGSAGRNAHGNQFSGFCSLLLHSVHVFQLTPCIRERTEKHLSIVRELEVFIGDLVQYWLVRHNNKHSLLHLGSFRKAYSQ